MAHELYNQLDIAYDFLNRKLFKGRLPGCIITVQRENENVHAYYSYRRFVSKNKPGHFIDEIAMNPYYFVNVKFQNALATLVHECTHQLQQHFGKPTARYHNKEWAEMMQSVGLMPSNTGKKGGRITGQKMADYIIKDGPFDRACKELLTKNFEISWYDSRIMYCSVFTKQTALEPVNYGDPYDGDLLEAIRSSIRQDKSNDIEDQQPGSDTTDPELSQPEYITAIANSIKTEIIDIVSETKAQKNKTVYQCPNCGVKVWGRPALSLHCNQCEQDFIEK